MKVTYENDIVGALINGVDSNDYTDEDLVNQKYEKLYKVIEPCCIYFLDFYNFSIKRKNYGVGRDVTMLEVHYLIDINDNPGITNTQLAKKWKKTTSAISQTIKKLIQWDYIERRIGQDAKNFLLYATEEGKKLVLAHKKYDVQNIIRVQNKLLEKFTVDELINFTQVCEEYCKILEDDNK